MTHLRFIPTSPIRPTKIPHQNDQFTQRIELTPWDLQLLLVDHIHKGLLFQKPKVHFQEEPSSNSLIEHLKATLSQALDIFYPLAGRLALTENDDHTSSVFLHCNGEEARFIHASADGIMVDDILKPTIDHDLVDSFATNGVLSYRGISKPLLAVQVTELADGIFIGCSLNHSVGDGTSFWHFFNTWSRISRGCNDQLSQPPPDISRHYFDGIVDLPIHIPS